MERVVYEYLQHLVSTDPNHFFSVKRFTRDSNERFHFKPNKWKCTSYVPDFKLITSKGIYYIEVKGFMDFFDSLKIRLFHLNYPYLKLRVIGKKEYEWIKKRMK